MVGENLMCAGLPSPVIHHQSDTRSRERSQGYSYFPEPRFEERDGSLGSCESQRHEGEAREVVLTRGEEACGGEGKRGGWCRGV